jgi:N-methylhydantoinase A/oxoprolinase/acetone carboxylase beta subunit
MLRCSTPRAAAQGLQDALSAHGIQARLFFSQNDRTLMALEYASRYPILTVASGPANSIRGAAFLSGQQNAVVVDVGGTSTDVGILVNGFPGEAAVAVDIAGVRTNFRTPDLVSIALGRGTRIRAGQAIRIGPYQRRVPPHAGGANLRRWRPDPFGRGGCRRPGGHW